MIAFDEPDRVSAGNACPECGENEIDSLVWVDDDTVRCETCGRLYRPDER